MGMAYKLHDQINIFFLILLTRVPEMFIRLRDLFSPDLKFTVLYFRLELERGSSLAFFGEIKTILYEAFKDKGQLYVFISALCS